MDVVSIRKYEFEDGTTLYVRIDRENNKVSFVEKNGNGYTPKKWLFAERGLEYMNGWINILGAMRYCILDAKKELEQYEQAKKDKLITIMVALHNEDEKNDKPKSSKS